MPDPSLDATIERLQAVIAAAVEIVNLIETGHANSGHAKRSAVRLREALNDLGPDAVDRLQACIERLRKAHTKSDHLWGTRVGFPGVYDLPLCDECETEWPCDTATLLAALPVAPSFVEPARQLVSSLQPRPSPAPDGELHLPPLTTRESTDQRNTVIHARPDYNGRFLDTGAVGRPDHRIPDDEPVLLVRGQDSAAPATARAWADENDRLGGDPTMSALVRRHARRIEEYQRTTGRSKLADMPAPRD